MKEKSIFKGFHFSNLIIALCNKNTIGQYDNALQSQIRIFAEKDFDTLVKLCIQDTRIAKACDRPIPNLQQFWCDKLIADYPHLVEDEKTTAFQQILEYEQDNQSVKNTSNI